MGKRVITERFDDIDGSILDGNATTVEFSANGTQYEIDLSEDNAAAFRQALAPYLARARVVAGSHASRRGRGAASTTSKRDLAPIRSWARENGHNVSERGRIPASVLAAYDSSQ